ncbi:helix-turn-helix protein [Promicromonospora sp. AC04]|uniref:helix-turn-helix domain-containing protein n=1 Tax=Promicromonospora sp. AC04 TaxID=2135723 RepID=UPI000D3C93A1|nr:helix-turn-helix domain-containing protein [Promicromonospora sp. AC04]PUB27704.1 helix-turn-helix protein [Promicromonospora sp. AC04]
MGYPVEPYRRDPGAGSDQPSDAQAERDGQVWSSSWTAGIGERLRSARRAAGLTTQQVADRTAALGYPMARASIANLETRPREKIYLQDVTVLAAALGVSPVEILYPLEVSTVPTATPTPVGVVRRGVLRNTSTQVLPGRTQRTPSAVAWFTGGYGRVLEARLAAITAYGRFEARGQLLAMLIEEEAAGTLEARAQTAGAPAPTEFMRVLRMEVYDLARWALDTIATYEHLAARVGDTRPAVSDEEREIAEHVAATPPAGYIQDPYERPYVHGVLTIGASEPGAIPFYLQDDPEDRWTPPDLTRPATAFETAPEDPPRRTKPKPRKAEPWPAPEGPPRRRSGGGIEAPGL